MRIAVALARRRIAASDGAHHSAGDSQLGQLEGHCSGVADNPRTDFYHPLSGCMFLVNGNGMADYQRDSIVLVGNLSDIRRHVQYRSLGAARCLKVRLRMLVRSWQCQQ